MSAALLPCVILNPHASGGRGRRRWEEFLRTGTARDLRLGEAPLYEAHPSGLPAWVGACIAAGHRDFVAAGGDGTVNAAVNALLCHPAVAECRLGAVALGSSNDFHKGRGRGGPRLDFAAAFPHDVGAATLDDGSTRYFAINASMGITAEANAYFNDGGGPAFRALKRRWTDGAIVAAALRGFALYRPFNATITGAGGERREARVVNLGVVKNRHFSGSFRYDVATGPADGRLGVHLCDGMSKAETLGTLTALARGRFSGRRKTASWQWTGLTVSAAKPFALETDGEVRLTTRAEFSVRKGGLLLCP